MGLQRGPKASQKEQLEVVDGIEVANHAAAEKNPVNKIVIYVLHQYSIFKQSIRISIGAVQSGYGSASRSGPNWLAHQGVKPLIWSWATTTLVMTGNWGQKEMPRERVTLVRLPRSVLP